jgi:hypothetical protein
MDSWAVSTVSAPARAAVAVCPAMWATRCALSVIWRDVASNSLIVVLISLVAVACSFDPVACCVAAACSSAEEPPHTGDERQGEQRAGNDGQGCAARRRLHLVGALLEQPPFLYVHLAEHSAQTVHERLALARQNQLHGRLKAPAPPEVDRSFQLGQLRSHEWLRLVDPLLLILVVGCQLSEILEDLGQGPRPAPVGLEKGVGAGDDKPALAGFSVLQLAEGAADFLQDQVSVGDKITGLRERVDAPIRHETDGRQQHERDCEAGRDPSSKCPHVRYSCQVCLS